MATKKKKIIEKAVELLKSTPNGIRYSDLVRTIKKHLPEMAINTIHGCVWDLDKNISQIYKPARGLFRHVNYRDIELESGEQIVRKPIILKIKEEEFYKPFAEWLVNELEECTKAIPLGGNRFKSKWGTPDVIGMRKARQSDIVVLPVEIISAEIKTDSNNLITAFGQACSYKLFSHKSYIVVPKDSLADDISKLDSLCLIFGIGLVLFDNTNKDDPGFDIRVRPRKHDPDTYYANKYAKMIEGELFDI